MTFQPPSYAAVPDVTWSTADLCDAHMGDPAWGLQVLAPGLRSFGGRSWYFGEVVTAGTPGGAAMSLVNLLSTPGLGRVLVADAQGDPAHAVLGDRMAALAVQNGWAGVIVNGYVRDARDLARMPVGIHALGTRPNRAQNMQPATSGDPVSALDVQIVPGLWAYADEDGVILMNKRHAG